MRPEKNVSLNCCGLYTTSLVDQRSSWREAKDWTKGIYYSKYDTKQVKQFPRYRGITHVLMNPETSYEWKNQKKSEHQPFQ